MKNVVLKVGVMVCILGTAPKAFSADIPIDGYDYAVTDVSSKGLTANQLFRILSTSWMDLEHSVCANRAHIWSYELYRKFGIKTGTIFIFFGAKVWEGHKKSYWYHAGTYVVENGVELVLEQSYPKEVFKPLTVMEWMDNEMEGAADAAKCVELKKGQDQDLTSSFYYHSFLPNRRSNGKPAYDCYYRKVPGYIPYPETTAEQELGLDEDGNKIDEVITSFNQDTLLTACIDAFSGRNFLKRGAGKAHCKKFLGI